MNTNDLKSMIFKNYGLYPIFIFDEIDDYGNNEQVIIDSMNLKGPEDDFFVSYTAVTFIAAMMNEEEVEVPERNSFLDTHADYARLEPLPEHDHKDRTRVRMTCVVKFGPITGDEDMDHDY